MKYILLIGTMVSVAISTLSTGAMAQVACGDTITGNAKLMDNLTCGTVPALTIDGGRLDMRGYTVTCTDTGNGIELIGTNSRLTNGVVENCAHGVTFDGTGSHHVSKVTSQNNTSDGFRINSDNNHVVDCESLNNGNDGFEIDEGHGNLIMGSYAYMSGDEGFELDTGENVIINNVSESSVSENYEADGGENKLIGNVSIDAGSDGIDIDEDDNEVSGNQISGSGIDGIQANNSENRITGNTVSGSGEYDMFDSNDNCDQNLWEGNQFETRNQDCIN